MDNKLLTLAALSQLPSFTLDKDSMIRLRSVFGGGPVPEHLSGLPTRLELRLHPQGVQKGSCPLTTLMAHSSHFRHSLPGILGIESHPTARDQAIALGPIVAGQCVLSTTSLATSLLPREKGRRCDHCHVAVSTQQKLSRCSGCAAFWYCGVQCTQGS